MGIPAAGMVGMSDAQPQVPPAAAAPHDAWIVEQVLGALAASDCAGPKPRAVYLGTAEWLRFAAYAQGLTCVQPPRRYPEADSQRATLCGLPVFSVDAPSYFRVV